MLENYISLFNLPLIKVESSLVFFFSIVSYTALSLVEEKQVWLLWHTPPLSLAANVLVSSHN